MIKITKELLSSWFKEANEKYFNNEIEIEPNYVISKNTSRFGQFRPKTWTIEISTAYINSERNYRNTFLHELCHLYVRQKYGAYVQSHGYEWKEIADKVTLLTEGKYGTIQRVGGELDKFALRENHKLNRFVIFTDYEGKLAIAKYSNSDYISQLMNSDAIKSDTTIYYLTSYDTNMAKITLRRANCRSIRWSYIKMSPEEIMTKCSVVGSEVFKKKTNRAA